jgi:hypothetical protein
VEDAHFAKPVCGLCSEACRTKAALPSLPAQRCSGTTEVAFAKGWQYKLSRTAAAWDAAALPAAAPPRCEVGVEAMHHCMRVRLLHHNRRLH